MSKPAFARLLREARKQASLSVAELAAKASLSREAIRLYENSTRRPTWDAVQQLAAALGISTEAFRDK